MSALTTRFAMPLPAMRPNAETRIALSTPPMTACIRKKTTTTPNTRQPLPRTSRRLRPSDAKIPSCSMTRTGTASAHHVSRIRPGMMISTKPMAMPIPATMASPNRGRMSGATERRSPPGVKSRTPSWMSRTASTMTP